MKSTKVEKCENPINRAISKALHEFDALLSLGKIITVEKGQIISAPNNFCNNCFYILNGDLEIYGLDSEGNSYTVTIMTKSQIVLEDNILYYTHSSYGLLSMTDCTLLSISQSKFDDNLREHLKPIYQEFIYLIIGKHPYSEISEEMIASPAKFMIVEEIKENYPFCVVGQIIKTRYFFYLENGSASFVVDEIHQKKVGLFAIRSKERQRKILVNVNAKDILILASPTDRQYPFTIIASSKKVEYIRFNLDLCSGHKKVFFSILSSLLSRRGMFLDRMKQRSLNKKIKEKNSHCERGVLKMLSFPTPQRNKFFGVNLLQKTSTFKQKSDTFDSFTYGRNIPIWEFENLKKKLISRYLLHKRFQKESPRTTKSDLFKLFKRPYRTKDVLDKSQVFSMYKFYKDEQNLAPKVKNKSQSLPFCKVFRNKYYDLRIGKHGIKVLNNKRRNGENKSICNYSFG